MNDSRDRSLPGLLPVELALVAALFWADERGWIPLSKTPFLLAVGWASMWLRGVTWRAAGLSLPANWKKFAAIGVAAGALGVLARDHPAADPRPERRYARARGDDALARRPPGP